MGQPLLTELQPWEGRQASKQHGQGHDKRVHRLPWEQRGGQGGCPGGGQGCGGGGTEDFPKEMTLEQSLEGRLGLKWGEGALDRWASIFQEGGWHLQCTWIKDKGRQTSDEVRGLYRYLTGFSPRANPVAQWVTQLVFFQPGTSGGLQTLRSYQKGYTL